MPSSSAPSLKFASDYSKAIADALREKEDGPPKLRSKEERVQDAYRALLFDDPHVESDEACRLLAKELVGGNKKYALSERLVEGLRQATARMEVIVVAKKAPEQQEEQAVEKDDDEDEDPDAEWKTVGRATTVGYAMLAVAVFCEIPLKCCQARDLQTVQSLLGSYRGPRHAANEKQRVEDILEEKMKALKFEKKMEEEQKQQEGKQQEQVVQQPASNNDGDGSKYKEVWADESDPSDFVFESDAAKDIDWSAWDDTSFDPESLSKPITDDGWPEVQQAVSNLLTDLTHSKFVPLNATLWKRHNLSDSLTQLTLTLLVEQGNTMAEALRQWSVQPINVLRDHILTKQPGQQQPHLDTDARSCLVDYLSLIQSLIAVDAAQDDPKADMAPASIVGLASLSSVCTQAKQLKEIPKIRKSALESCEDLCSLVERALSSVSNAATSAASGEAVTSWVPLVWAFLPLLELISYTQPDGTSLHTIRTVTAADSQWLLNSGLFRNLIMLYVKTAPYSSSAEEVARQHLLQGLQMLSLQSMTLLGKYAWRVPDLNTLIHEEGYQENHAVDGLMWSLMGQQLAGSSVLRMRNVKLVTPDSSRESAIRQWEVLCQTVVGALKTLGELRLKPTKNKEHSKDWKEPIAELGRFSNCLVSCAALPALWQEAMTKTSLEQHLLPMKEALSNLPPAPSATTTDGGGKESASASVAKTAENDKAGDPLERPKDSFEQEVGMVRKAIKIVTMSLQQEESSMRISSKTD